MRLDSKKYLARELDGEYVLLDLESGDYFTFEGCGSRAFALLLEGLDPAAAARRIAEENPGTPPERVRKDVEEFARGLRKKGVLVEP